MNVEEKIIESVKGAFEIVGNFKVFCGHEIDPKVVKAISKECELMTIDEISKYLMYSVENGFLDVKEGVIILSDYQLLE
jgi:hypothetical protein